MSKLKVGVVGAGIGRRHLQGYSQLPDAVEIAAICDVDEARLKEIGDMFSVPLRYTNVYDFIQSGEIEAVSVCLPNNLHAPISIAALEAGLHVLCEKPIADSVAGAQKIVEAAAVASGKFMVCYNRRYRPDVLWMKAALSQGVLGQVYQVKTGWVRETGIPGWGGWFTSKELAGGGVLIDLGVHMLDLALWILDYPQPLTVSGSVLANFGPRQAKSWRRRSGQPGPFSVEDLALAFIRLSSGATLSLETSWASHSRPGMDDFYLTLQGTHGTVEYYVANYATEDTLTLYTEINGAPVVTRPAIQSGTMSDHDYAVAEFVKCIREDSVPDASAEQGLTIMKVIEAIYQSAQAGQERKIS